MNYQEFLESKLQPDTYPGFKPVWMPDILFDFQKELVEWSARKSCALIGANTGMGKTPVQLTWAENVVRITNGRVLVLTPLAVSFQTVEEGIKFGIDCERIIGDNPNKNIHVTNYERLHLCTATPAPNDYVELGTSSEALGGLGYMDMLGMFFKNDQNSLHPTSGRGRFEMGAIMAQNKWRFKHHAERPFWRWVSSWARIIRKPSDLNKNYEDARYNLPPLIENEIVVKRNKPLDGFLFDMPAVGLKEQREERKSTIKERCEKVAERVSARKGKAAVCWCHLNAEGDLLSDMMPDAKQVSGSQKDDEKESIFKAFADGSVKTLIVKPKIGAWGLNWQHCDYMTFFPSHSFEQYYQGVRRCWRFGQKNPVTVDIITTEGELGVLQNLRKKAIQADKMLDMMLQEMNQEVIISRNQFHPNQETEKPKWMLPTKKSRTSTRSTMETAAKS